MGDARADIMGLSDYVYQRTRNRLAGLTDDEYFWEPVPGCCTIRRTESGDYRADYAEWSGNPPFTTIAWRLWHLGSECLAGYTRHGLGPWPLQVQDGEWYAAPGPALEALDQAWRAFREGLAQLGEAGLWQPPGTAGDEPAERPWAGLVLHAQDELSHHGAEIALLRDLYVRQGG